jgi:hypothetical protein
MKTVHIEEVMLKAAFNYSVHHFYVAKIETLSLQILISQTHRRAKKKDQ